MDELYLDGDSIARFQVEEEAAERDDDAPRSPTQAAEATAIAFVEALNNVVEYETLARVLDEFNRLSPGGMRLATVTTKGPKP